MYWEAHLLKYATEKKLKCFADKALGRLTSLCLRTESIVSLERGFFFRVPNWKSFLVTEVERKHVRRRARFQQHRDASYQKVFIFLQRKELKEIHAILTETLGEHASSYAIVRNCVLQFKRGDFSTCDAPRPGRPKTVTIPEIIDQIHEIILEDCRISAKSIDE